jgi:hypothetical protein
LTAPFLYLSDSGYLIGQGIEVSRQSDVVFNDQRSISPVRDDLLKGVGVTSGTLRYQQRTEITRVKDQSKRCRRDAE